MNGRRPIPQDPPARAGDSRPTPDPTSLTTAQLRRELGSLEELINVRLDAMDKATELLGETDKRVEQDTEKRIVHLKELHTEKFESVQKQFVERDARTDKVADLGQKALDAALAAAKEAVEKQNAANQSAITKSETATAKMLDQQGILIHSSAATTDSKITDLKERLSVIEGRKEGMVGLYAILLSAVGTITSIAAVIIALLKS